MKRKSAQLAERRQQLIARAALQRAHLARELKLWQAPLQLVDHAISILTYVKRQPVLLLGASVLITTLRLKRTRKWLQRGWLVWQLGRRLFAKQPRQL